MPEQCPDCHEEMTRKRQDHHVVRSGLNNIILINWEGFYSDHCGTYIPILPDPDELLKVLIKAILIKPSLLNNNEISFLRQKSGMSLSEFGFVIGVREKYLLDLEHNREIIDTYTDDMIRKTILHHFRHNLHSDFKEEVEKSFSTKKVFKEGFRIYLTRNESNELGYFNTYSS